MIVPQINPNSKWKVNKAEQVSACDNRPGLKKIYVTVVDKAGRALLGVKVRFDTEPSYGVVYDHPNPWGLTNRKGYAVWDHLGVPTRYRLYMGDQLVPLIENIRTDLPNEYCKLGGFWSRFGNRPTSGNGKVSYRIEIQRR